MAESTLSLDLDGLRSRIGKYLGYGYGDKFGETAWGATQLRDINLCLDDGLRQFYFPTAQAGSNSPYDWSFLRPYSTINLIQGIYTVQMPDDFGGFEGRLTILATPVSTNGQIPWPIELQNSQTVRLLFAESPTTTGRPLVAGLEPLKGTTKVAGQRQQLVIFPIPDQTYVLQFQYYVLPDALTTANPFHYGGMAHAQTVIEACLMSAEQFLDDSSTVHAMKFQERLTASIGIDRRNKPQRLGRNRDGSDDDRAWVNSDYHWWGFPPATYNGQSFGSS